jgi:DNA mismatch endonuclease, patch repair protein
MTDVLTPEQRHRNMSRIRSGDTRPELAVRSMVHRLGYRFRLHVPDLPGRPDLVLPRHSKVIFVHGCYWHMHRCRYGSVVPKTNRVFWQRKRKGNVQRDRRQIAVLRRRGWKVLVIWECWTRKRDLENRLLKFLWT